MYWLFTLLIEDLNTFGHCVHLVLTIKGLLFLSYNLIYKENTKMSSTEDIAINITAIYTDK